MKTIQVVNKEIEEIKNQIRELDTYTDKKSITTRKRLRSKLPQLKQYALYLETNPTKEYCEKEVERLTNRINKVSELYTPPAAPERFTKGQLSSMKSNFEKQWDLPKIRKQLTAVNYLLK